MAGLFELRTLDGAPSKLILRDIQKVLYDMQWRGRLEKVQTAILRKMAETAYAEMMRLIPRSRDMRYYRKALKLGQMRGGGLSGFAIYAVQRAMKLSQSQADRQVIFIEPLASQSPRRRKPFVDVLMDYAPWTADTLPITPTSQEAKVVFRAATRAEVVKIRESRKRDAPAWKKALAETGVKPAKAPPKEIVGASDLAFLAMRLEFGLGAQHRAHWRPAIQKAKLQLQREWMKGSSPNSWARWLWDPDNKKWSVPKRRLPMIDSGVVKRFSRFVRKIQI